MRFFLVSAVFHYLGPAFAVLLFASVEPLGVAWLRIASAALVFALWRGAWRRPSKAEVALGLTLAAMNCVFYLAIDRLPLATVGAIEFLAPIALALRRRGQGVLGLAVTGVALLTPVSFTGSAVGFGLAFLNCGLFGLYLVLAKRVAATSGIGGLARAMPVAALACAPIGFADAAAAFADPRLLAAAVGVGLCSSVVPYVCDQLALARMSRQRFAFLMCLLPATATVIGLLVLRQVPGPMELVGVALIAAAVALNSRSDNGLRPIRNGGAGSVPDLPRDDELRQPIEARLAP